MSSSAPAIGPKSARGGFREDIQGLRGVAILLVVLFHSGLAMPGGFIGVDVFFVLSGYLIAGLLVDELAQSGDIDLRRFYARRIRRLLPALATLTSFTLLASLVVVELGEPLRLVGRTAIAASVSAANVVLYRDHGYFGPDAEANPLLHTWSLSVEEQFYVIFPLVVLLGVRIGTRRRRTGEATLRALLILVAALTLVSFLSSVAHVDLGLTPPGLSSARRFAFFSPTSRAWEFGAGALLAIRARTRPVGTGAIPRRDGMVRTLGLIGIVVSAFSLGPASPYPGLRAIAPVLATLLVLGVRPPEPSPVARFLRSRSLGRLGTLSYSWYLWHWPVLVLSRERLGSSVQVTIVAVLLSILPAVASYRFVESRFRYPRPPRRSAGRITRARSVAVVSVLTPVVLALGLLLLDANVRPVGEQQLRQRSWSRVPCHFEWEQSGPWPSAACVRGSAEGRVDVLLIGDSHADAIADAVLAAAIAEGLSVGVWTRSAGVFVGDAAWGREVQELIEELQPTVVVTALYSAKKLTEEFRPAWQSMPTQRGEDALSSWGRAVRATAEEIRSNGPELIWVLQVPAFLEPRGRPTVLDPSGRPTSIPLSRLDPQRALIVEVERRALAGLPGVRLVDPAVAVCALEVCTDKIDGAWLWRDSNHLTPIGAARLVPILREALVARDVR
jgi:peptidoglycan/LPS O-acetylase OafA/YrhL